MKNLKLLTFAFTLLMLVFQSCSKNDSTSDTENDNDNDGTANYSATIKTVASNLTGKIDQSSGTETASDMSQMLTFNFCFDFVYPVTVRYNDGTTTTISNETQLLSALQNSTTSHYIDGVVFPFQVETAGSTVTINDENAFANILSNCDLDGDGIMNYLDTDGDGDGIANAIEDLNGDGIETNDDTDNDGNPNYMDMDDDGDGVNTENEDADHNGDSADDDSDGDGIPNYLDTDSDNDGIEDGDDPDADGDGTNDDEEGNEGGDGDGD